MDRDADVAGIPPTQSSRLPVVLWAGGGVMLLAAGLVLWSARGAAVFTDVVSAALAWCF